MNEILEIALALSATIAFGIAITIEIRKSLALKKENARRAEQKLKWIRASQQATERIVLIDTIVNYRAPHSSLPWMFPDLLMPSGVNLSQQEIEKMVAQKVDEVTKRVASIEDRLPAQEHIDKIASVNDAILATNIETINDSLRRLEARMLTKWDVAKIVFTVIGSLGALVGIVLAILKLF